MLKISQNLKSKATAEAVANRNKVIIEITID